MDVEVAQVACGVHAIAVWDSSWNSYNNAYLIESEDLTVLVDCGKAEHAGALIEAIAKLGKRPDDVDHVIVTHGHKDHAGGGPWFSRATKWVHPDDRERLNPEELRACFSGNIPDQGHLFGFDVLKLAHHRELVD